MKKFKIYSTVLTVILALLLISGCDAKTNDNNASSGGSGKVMFNVEVNGKTTAVTDKDIKKLPTSQITVEGKVEEGPSLKEVLNFAGAKDFKQVTIKGSGSIVLTKEQAEKPVLDLTNRGTVKFSSPDVPKNQWVKDITTIKVE